MRIAIIEDDVFLSNKIAKKLKTKGYETIVSNSVEEFKKKVLDYANLYIIDLGLGDGRGEEIVIWIRNIKKLNTPILIMSGYSDTETKIKLFHLGADDYICKPLSAEELIARVEVLLRRGTKINNKKIKYRNFIFDFSNKVLFKSNIKIELTRKETQIVELFLLHLGKMVKKDDLIFSVWGKSDILDVTFNSINVTIYRLRKKVGYEFDIETILGEGYILRE